MTLKHNDIHLMIGGWILIGLAVAGLNTYAFVTLLDTPLAGYSPGVRAADSGMRQLRTILGAENQKFIAGLDRLRNRFAPKAVAAEPPPQAKPATVAPMVAKPAPEALPALAGIVTSRASDGVVRRLALLDGTLLSEGETLDGLTVQAISSRGVRISRDGRSWFLEAPDNTYSLTKR